ncbi:MAG: HTH-type transcriptional regulator ZntR [Paracidovorax wautersii]|uniref:HTH-type transcriptional regulator ZntR n=1 Tax=Paracidovorax wautersii TaxID=1177982 RepID=A0A7V8FN36_9BURK|nr:MAG: HTH-type transcriptional regulator ZntR [Paracidovorax wautersii]
MDRENPSYRIGQAAQAAGLSAASIRFYEKEGLLGPGTRSEASYRLYSDEDVHRLRFIRLCRALDMSLDEVRTLLALDLRDHADCERAQQTLDEHLRHVHERMAELRALERDLQSLRACCDGQGPHCGIMEALHARADEPVPEAEPRGPAHRHV